MKRHLKRLHGLDEADGYGLYYYKSMKASYLR
jgi:hypothetical protein